MEEKIMLNAILVTERNFIRCDHNFSKVANVINKQKKCISKVAGLTGVGFIYIFVLFHIQDKQIKALQEQVNRLQQPSEGCCGECGCDDFEKGFNENLDEEE